MFICTEWNHLNLRTLNYGSVHRLTGSRMVNLKKIQDHHPENASGTGTKTKFAGDGCQVPFPPQRPWTHLEDSCFPLLSTKIRRRGRDLRDRCWVCPPAAAGSAARPAVPLETGPGRAVTAEPGVGRAGKKESDHAMRGFRKRATMP